MVASEVREPAFPLAAALSVALLVAMVGGAIVAGQLVQGTKTAPAPTSSPPRTSPLAEPTATPSSALLPSPPDSAECVGGCPRPGTACDGAKCRLAPGAKWRLRPQRILKIDSARAPTSTACVLLPDRPRTCLTGQAAGREGPFLAFDTPGTPFFDVTTEDLGIGGLELEVDGERGRAPQQRFTASPVFFDVGMMLRVRDEGSGVRFRVEQIP